RRRGSQPSRHHQVTEHVVRHQRRVPHTVLVVTADRVRIVLHPPVRGVVTEPVHARDVLVHQGVVDRVRVHDARLLGDSVGSESSQALTSSTRTTGRLVGYRWTSWFVRIASQMTRSDIPVASAIWSTRRDSGSPMWCSLWLGGGWSPPSTEAVSRVTGGVCAGGDRQTGRLLRWDVERGSRPSAGSNR